MNWYSFVFIWLIFMLFVSTINGSKKQMIIDGKIVYRWRLLFALFAIWPVFYLATMCDPISDTIAYLDMYKKLPSDTAEFLTSLHDAVSGQGFIVFEFLCKRIFGNSLKAFRLCLGLIHTIPVVIIFRKYSENYLLTLYLFLASACHIGWMMNGLRQFMAVTIIFVATPLLLKKKYIAMLVVILLAATVHTSALIMVPVIFIVNGKAWNRRTILYIILAIIAMYLFGKYTGLLDSMLVGTEYEGATTAWAELGDDGVNPVRVLVSAVPMIMGWFGRRYISRKDTVVNVCVNFSIITTGLYLIAMTTSGIMLGRLPIYTSLYSFILLPALIERIFSKDSQRLVNLIMILLYAVYYYFETGMFVV